VGPSAPVRGGGGRPVPPGRGSRTPGSREARIPPPGTAGWPGGPSGAPEAQIPEKGEIWAKMPKIPYFGGSPGEPRKRPFWGLRGATGGPPRGVDVKPPSRGGPGDAEKPEFGLKSPKWAKKPENGQKGRFSGFRGFSGPLGAPRGPRKRGFYINPSRRGPAVPRGLGLGKRAAQARGKPPEGVQGVSPWGVAVRHRAAPGVPALRPSVS